MKIEIEDLKFQCIIGILDFEREAPQDVIINISLSYDYNDDFLNYAEIVELVKTTMVNEKFLLIEDALHSLTKKLKEKIETRLNEYLFFDLDEESHVTFVREGDTYVRVDGTYPVEYRLQGVAGTIDVSLYASLQEIDAPLSLASKMINSQAINRVVREYIDGNIDAAAAVAKMNEELAAIE